MRAVADRRGRTAGTRSRQDASLPCLLSRSRELRRSATLLIDLPILSHSSFPGSKHSSLPPSLLSCPLPSLLLSLSLQACSVLILPSLPSSIHVSNSQHPPPHSLANARLVLSVCCFLPSIHPAYPSLHLHPILETIHLTPSSLDRSPVAHPRSCQHRGQRR